MTPTNGSADRRLAALTAVAVSTEIALLVHSLTERDPVYATCLIFTGFHSGYLGAHVLQRRPPRSTTFVVAASFVALGLLVLDWRWPLASVAAALISAGLQLWRRSLKPFASLSASRKNAAKALGMTFGGVAALPGPSAAVWILALGGIAIFSRPLQGGRLAAAVGPSSSIATTLALSEFLHHAHYFSYVYAFWALLHPLPLMALGGLFAVGWLGYFVAEIVFRERDRIYSPVLLALGHYVAACAIFGLGFATSLLPALLLWWITGVGGGTAFMLSNGPQHPRRELFEDAGHVAGTLAGALSAAVTGSAIGAIWAGVILALADAVLFTVIARVPSPATDRRRECA